MRRRHLCAGASTPAHSNLPQFVTALERRSRVPLDVFFPSVGLLDRRPAPSARVPDHLAPSTRRAEGDEARLGEGGTEGPMAERSSSVSASARSDSPSWKSLVGASPRVPRNTARTDHQVARHLVSRPRAVAEEA